MTMSSNKKTGTSQFLNSISEVLADPAGRSTEEIKNDLRTSGIDIDGITKKVEQLISSKLEESKRSWITEANSERTKKLALLNSIAVAIPDSFDELKNNLAALIKSEPNLALAYRNFSEMSEDDMRDLYVDLIRQIKLREEKTTSHE